MQESVLDGKKVSEEIIQHLQPYDRSQKSNEKFIYADRIESYFEKSELKIETIPFLPGSNYALK